MATKYDHSNGSFHRVLACSAGGPGFDHLRHNILRCCMQKDVDGSGQASTILYNLLFLSVFFALKGQLREVIYLRISILSRELDMI
jgi:hypothetical protein